MQSFKDFITENILYKELTPLNEAQSNDPHEVMTLAICLNGLDNIPKELDLDENGSLRETLYFDDSDNKRIKDKQRISRKKINKYIESLAKEVKNITKFYDSITAVDTKNNKNFTSNLPVYKYSDLMKAISAACAIFKNTNRTKFNNGWLVGTAFPPQFSKFKLNTDPEYNSSDIILELTKNKYLGISLKKATPSENPTLINQNLKTIFIKNDSISDVAEKISDNLESAIDKFFVSIFNDTTNTWETPCINTETEETENINLTLKEMIGMQDIKCTKSNWRDFYKRIRDIRSITKAINNNKKSRAKNQNTVTHNKKEYTPVPDYHVIESDVLGYYLKSNLFTPLKRFDKIILNNKEVFINALLDVSFKGRLSDFQKYGFYFALVEGIAQNGNDYIKSESGEYYSLNTVLTVLSEFAQNADKFDLVRNKKIKFNQDLTAASTEYSLVGEFRGNIIPILKIVARYKGLSSFDKPPAFQAYLTDELKAIL